MSKKKKILLISLVSVLCIIVVGLGAGANYLVSYAFENPLKSIRAPKLKGIDAQSISWLKKQDQEVWHQRAVGTDLDLVAYYLPAKTKTNKTIVVAHGYQGSHWNMASYIKMFHELGYNVLAPDDRGSGASQGKYIHFGWDDRLDYIKWVKQVIAKDGQDSRIGLFGVSMGGATVMMMSGEKLPSQVKAIIEDCGYSKTEDELAYQLKAQFGLPKEPLITLANWIAKARVGFDFKEADSLKQLQKNKLPIFFIHGDKDDFVPTKMVYQSYRATTAPKQIWITKNTTHAKSYINYPKQYQEKVKTFLDKYMN